MNQLIIIKLIAMNFLLMIMAIQDAKTMHVNLFILLMFVFVAFDRNMHILPFLILAAIFIFEYWRYWSNKSNKKISNKIAWADMIVIAFTIANLPSAYVGLFLFLLGISATLFGLYKGYVNEYKNFGFKIKENNANNMPVKNELLMLPLMPFIFFAYFIVSILLYIL